MADKSIMSEQNFNHPQNPPPTQQIIQNQQVTIPQVTIPEESQSLPAIVAVFLGGIGLLVQGRTTAGLSWLAIEILLGGFLLLLTIAVSLQITLGLLPTTTQC